MLHEVDFGKLEKADDCWVNSRIMTLDDSCGKKDVEISMWTDSSV